MTNATTVTTWVLYYVYSFSKRKVFKYTSKNRNHLSTVSRCFYVCTQNTNLYDQYSKCLMILKQDRIGTSRMLTIANQSDVPIKQNLSLTCFSSILRN